MPLHGFLFGRRWHFGASPADKPRSRDVIQVMISASFFTLSRNRGTAGPSCRLFNQCLMSITHIYQTSPFNKLVSFRPIAPSNGLLFISAIPAPRFRIKSFHQLQKSP